jgi:hypothetical protein
VGREVETSRQRQCGRKKHTETGGRREAGRRYRQVESSHADKGTEAGGCRGRQAGAVTQECRRKGKEGKKANRERQNSTGRELCF